MSIGTLNTTTLSSKGQIVIPEPLRKSMHLDAGAQFVVMGHGDTLILKVLEAPNLEQFKGLLKKARQGAARAGLRKADIAAAIRKVRAGR